MPKILFCNQVEDITRSFFIEQRSNSGSFNNAKTQSPSLFSFTEIEYTQTGIDILDRGLNYGDGTFTTALVDAQIGIYLFNEHIERLALSFKTLSIQIDINLLKNVIMAICKKVFEDGSVESQCILKVLVTRGAGGRGYTPPEQAKPTIIITLSKYERNCLAYPSHQQALHLGLAKIKLAHQPVLAGLKHANRLEQVMAKLELRDMLVDDLLLTCQSGFLIEATASNVFLYSNGVWFTPRLLQCGVKGVMRNAIIKHLEQIGTPVKEAEIPIEELGNYESIFLCNALNPIVPVNSASINKTSEPIQYGIEPIEQLFSTFVPFLKEQTVFEW